MLLWVSWSSHLSRQELLFSLQEMKEYEKELCSWLKVASKNFYRKLDAQELPGFIALCCVLWAVKVLWVRLSVTVNYSKLLFRFQENGYKTDVVFAINRCNFYLTLAAFVSIFSRKEDSHISFHSSCCKSYTKAAKWWQYLFFLTAAEFSKTISSYLLVIPIVPIL